MAALAVPRSQYDLDAVVVGCGQAVHRAAQHGLRRRVTGTHGHPGMACAAWTPSAGKPSVTWSPCTPAWVYWARYCDGIRTVGQPLMRNDVDPGGRRCAGARGAVRAPS